MNIREEFVKAYQEFANDDDRRAINKKHAEQLIEANDIQFVMFKMAVLATERAQPTVYISSNADGLDIAAYPCDHPNQIELDSYTMELVELRQLERVAKERTHHISLNVLRNVLSRAGVRVVIE